MGPNEIIPYDIKIISYNISNIIQNPGARVPGAGPRDLNIIILINIYSFTRARGIEPLSHDLKSQIITVILYSYIYKLIWIIYITGPLRSAEGPFIKNLLI